MAKRTTTATFSTVLLACVCLCRGEGYNSMFDFKLLYPYPGTAGMFLALAIPLALPDERVFVASLVEANYLLPFNLSYIGEYPPVIQRSASGLDGDSAKSETTPNAKLFGRINRKVVYDVLESKITTHGYPGRGCLLRAICETALYPVNETNGVFGDLVHIIFTPSSSKGTEPLQEEYQGAENYGRDKENCAPYRKKCKISILDLVSLPVGVHSRMGRDRAGVMAACYLVRFRGLDPENAVTELKAKRPRSVEEPELETAVNEYYESIKQKES